MRELMIVTKSIYLYPFSLQAIPLQNGKTTIHQVNVQSLVMEKRCFAILDS